MTFEQRGGCSEGMSHTRVWGIIIPGGGNSKCKGPEAGMCLAYLPDHEKLVHLKQSEGRVIDRSDHARTTSSMASHTREGSWILFLVQWETQ